MLRAARLAIETVDFYLSCQDLERWTVLSPRQGVRS